MNKAQLGGLWDHFRMINGITLRGIKEIPSDKIDSRPVRDMRTPKELIVHMYDTMREVVQGVAGGEIQAYDEEEKETAAKIRTHDDLIRHASDTWKSADRTVQSLTDQQIAGIVKTPWGESFPGFVCIQILYDEHLHHRGQMYAYLRQLGIEPPFMWDFEHNAPEFQPKAAAQQA